MVKVNMVYMENVTVGTNESNNSPGIRLLISDRQCPTIAKIFHLINGKHDLTVEVLAVI